MWEQGVDIHEVRELRVNSLVYLGVGAIHKIEEIAAQLKAREIASVLVVSGRNAYKATGAWDIIRAALDKNGIKYVNYDRVSANPTVDQVDEAAAMGRAALATAVIAIGGGSPIDAGKSAAILLKYPDRTARDIYEYSFSPSEAVPIVAVNLTHGTGTEADRFAVVTVPEKEFKPVVAYDCLYPTWSIDDPALTVGLPPNQTRYVSIDAVNHVVEAATSKGASPYSIMLAKETIRLVAAYLPAALADGKDLTARYFLHYASLIAGVAFDNALLHYTHALEHPLSAVKPDLTHGLGLAMLLPAVVKNIYPAEAAVLADILSPIVPGLSADVEDGSVAARGVEKWLCSVGADHKLADEGFGEKDIPRLVELTFTTPSLSLLLSMAPTLADRQAVEEIYRESLRPMR
ncbi:iron-containing alcohol dehydrogenase [Victivallis sp. Marseille-Q1083]|uniref:iron-containing alcohol dehydrogenase n=1 Tax=Victivallis sp. Marseille-Q1083 TaxID=2717288 RepID=UPI001589B290|nr:iron-containing alcohol dehydrogenase [Victivallis sp. Marseille-Q1083]